VGKGKKENLNKISLPVVSLACPDEFALSENRKDEMTDIHGETLRTPGEV